MVNVDTFKQKHMTTNSMNTLTRGLDSYHRNITNGNSNTGVHSIYHTWHYAAWELPIRVSQKTNQIFRKIKSLEI